MARNLIILFCFCLLAIQLEAKTIPSKTTLSNSSEIESIQGSWEFYKLLYRNQEMPPINPHLRLYFEFKDETTNRLFYFHDDESGSCEREATYNYNEAELSLTQKVTWVNPDNKSQCGQDPDMHLGVETISHVEIKNGELFLEVPLSEETITYIWKRGQRPAQSP